MILAQVNARLVKVSGGGTSDDYGASAGADADKWVGNSDAYFNERVRYVTGQTASVVDASYVAVPSDLDVAFAIGDTITIEFDGATFTRDIAQIARSPLPGVLGGGQTRLYLRDT